MAESEQERAIREKLEEAQRLYQAGFSRAAEKRGAIKDAGEQFLKNLLGMGTETGGQNGVSVEFSPEQRRQINTVSVELPTEVTTSAVTPKLVPAPVTLMPPIDTVVPPTDTAVRPPSTAVPTIKKDVENTTTTAMRKGELTAKNKNAPIPSLLGNNAAYSSLLGQGEYAGPSTGMNRFIQILERMAVPGKSPAQAFAEGNLSLSAQEAAAAQSYLDRGLSQQKLQAQQKLLQAEADFKNREERRRINELGIKTADYFTKDMSKDEATRLIQVIKSELTSLGNKDLLARVNKKADEFGWGTSEETYQNLAVRYRRLLLKEELAGKPTSPLEKLTRVVNSLEVEGTPAQVKNSVTQQGNIGDPSVPIISLDAGF
tara:strand:+ start:613 stop:1731 length:1119 start_codon:yes stop_codon:yes gene_type:complete